MDYKKLVTKEPLGSYSKGGVQALTQGLGVNMNRIILATVMALVSIMGTATGTQFLNPEGKNTIIDSVYNDDLFITGNKIRFDAKVMGDMYASCNEIVYGDTVEGSLHVFCKSVEGLGPVGGSFLGFAYQISINAPVEKNILGFAPGIDIGPETIVGHDANLYGNTVTFQGHVKNDLIVHADDALINGRIDGDFYFEGGELSISPDAIIEGDLIYCSPEKAEIGDLAAISGEVKWTECIRENDEGLSATKAFSWIVSHRGYFLALSLFSILFFIVSVIPFPGALAIFMIWIALFISGNLFLMVTKNLSRKTETALKKKTLPSIGLGFAIIFLTPLAILILLLSIFAAPLSAVLILAFGLACFAGGVYTALFVGRRICALLNIGSKTSTGYGCYSLGMITLVALSFIPIIGYFLFLIIIMMGMGGLALAIYGKEGNELSSDTAN